MCLIESSLLSASHDRKACEEDGPPLPPPDAITRWMIIPTRKLQSHKRRGGHEHRDVLEPMY